MPSFSFNRIVILESLPSTDPLKTGYELYQYLVPLLQQKEHPASIEYIQFSSAEELIQIIVSLTNEARVSGNIPILHIETHGSSDGTGLALVDESNITWWNLGDLIVDLNRATRFNLFLVVAACYSGDFYEFEFRLDKPSPFCTFIAPSLEANGSEMLDGFRGLYRNMIESNDAWNALNHINKKRLNEGEFIVKVAHDIFFRIHEFLFSVDKSPETIKKIIRKHNLKLRSMFGPYARLPPPEIHRRALANADRQRLNDRFYKFFMISDIPENESRFQDIKIELEKLLARY